MRRLAVDHGHLHSESLPPNYLFAPGVDNEDLTQLDILLAGPTHTPFSSGVFKLHLTIPTTYPQQPPTAHFRTPIFHPNVDPQTGGVCVETLKRDWDAKLTLRDILVVIGCLLIQPNPDSALNAEAGQLIQEDYESFERRARLMTSIHAVVPRDLRDLVNEAQNRGADANEEEQKLQAVAAPPRRRRQIHGQRGGPGSRRVAGSPTAARSTRTLAASAIPRSLMLDTPGDDVFDDSIRLPLEDEARSQTDDSMVDENQENDETRSPTKAQTPPPLLAHRRRNGAAVPLGELTIEDTSMDSSEIEPEYPPSPSKSPSKSACKRKTRFTSPERPESSRDGATRGPNVTPPNLIDKPLAHDSPYVDQTPSPRKHRIHRPITPGWRPVDGNLFAQEVFSLGPERAQQGAGVTRRRSPSSSERKGSEERRRAQLVSRLWQLCGEDVGRWNRGDFTGGPFQKKAPRW